ncbi:hypothetical protein H0H93_001784 [Arthromyces matolae]|nr:hypothetical protein H0H93_001784 [Arthromyces matolae]
MKVAVQGCGHGDLDAIYRHIAQLERQNGYEVDLLIICGDFQAIRNFSDLHAIACPSKYRELKDFHRYYSGARKAPMPTILIGGNHESSSYMWELYHGGYVAPDMYFLGHAGSVMVNGLRISGASGIYKENHYNCGYFERLPFENEDLRSIYHVREFCVNKLSHLPRPDIFFSHDWPCTIDQHGDTQLLIKNKSYLQPDIEKQSLGSPPFMDLLKTLKPSWYFAGHMHTRFEAQVVHSSTGVGNDTVTNFLALDKCKPNRKFLDVIDIPNPAYDTAKKGSRTLRPKISFDPHWLAITRAFHPYMSLNRWTLPLPDEATLRASIQNELAWVKQNLPRKLNGGWAVDECQKFVRTAHPIPPTESGRMQGYVPKPKLYSNPQTVAFCDMLEIPNIINPNQPST